MSHALVDDDLWVRVERLLPKRRPRNRQYAGRTPIPDRAVLAGILFVLRSRIPWKMLPQEMGCGSGTTESQVIMRGNQRRSGSGCGWVTAIDAARICSHCRDERVAAGCG